ncbi:hypothetical protein PCC7805_00587 [Planktothrix agardhii]|jgi:DNA-binding CsgD family transcriptional regulator|uniref:Serine/threonine protein kinase n=1 Tax=Planktothrix agardhii TaxID=1160 RepID=A0A1J1JL63_PLAAG|nr:AAA-like domain-containing protein [Planktothrix agardhii]MBG0748488.1 AAA-like domain-containing protein [Planktothrix agardhii KL2]MCF3581930.1 AAA-like domain-containing protein [Planktothrix agardhii 1811]MCF3627205.1 AAA-like domain-containing protein [Planktothrix agardhii 1801]CAD5919748.1 hypothetical protein PCC7805_00587 [Planktothrix agardhii]CUM61719.1 protein of unknown function [Planktothrix agardhii]
MITQEQFNAIYPEQLNSKQHSVLKLFLQGESEDEIAKARKLNDKSSVRYHISNICKLFGLENQEGEHYWQRPELIEIFAKYKPELLNPQLIDNGGDNNLILESPDDGPVGLNSAFYVVRGSTETDCYQQIEKSGALLRIKAPSKMGKTSLLIRILHHAEEQDYEIVRLNLRDIGVSILENKSDFLKWFFENICEQLDLDYQWIESLDFTESKCKLKFQVKILKEIQKPMVLILEELEQVFPYTETVTTFASLLRSWHEESKKMEIWKKLRMVLLYSTNIYVKLPDKQSPFNVGVPVDLTEFNSKAVQDLAVCHQLKLTENQITQLMTIIGGFPYLVRLAFYRLARQEITFEQLLTTASRDDGIYGHYLRNHWADLQDNIELKIAFKEAIMSDNPVKFEQIVEFKLLATSLVKYEGNSLIPSCHLYRDYFREKFL